MNGFAFTSEYRTTCVRLFAEKYNQDRDFTDILLNLLKKEKALYTKLEIQNQLSKYGHISLMCQYLGCIGHNQYKEIPNKVSFDRNYPLPKDIIARSLANLDQARFLEFYHLLPTLPYLKFQEAIDSFGFFCFYHPDVVTQDMYRFVCSSFLTYKDHPIIIWKLVTCLSAFPMSTHFLEDFKKTQKNSTLIQEVERTLTIIHSSNNR